MLGGMWCAAPCSASSCRDGCSPTTSQSSVPSQGSTLACGPRKLGGQRDNVFAPTAIAAAAALEKVSVDLDTIHSKD